MHCWTATVKQFYGVTLMKSFNRLSFLLSLIGIWSYWKAVSHFWYSRFADAQSNTKSPSTRWRQIGFTFIDGKANPSGTFWSEISLNYSLKSTHNSLERFVSTQTIFLSKTISFNFRFLFWSSCSDKIPVSLFRRKNRYKNDSWPCSSSFP